ncbi:hypothetical protein K1719_035167 [Acacia pycnantha]|nr:hypothetical protein K1719_035167 [Acacia pycnantha]
MTVTKDALADFDWSSFNLQELCEEIYKFKKDSQKSKRKQSKTVGECLYFLMLFCFQNFSLGNIIASQQESAMAFWTDEKVKSRVLVEKRSKKGLLVCIKPRQPHTQPSVSLSTSFDPDTMLTHPEVHRKYARLLSNLQQEMMALQHRLSQESQYEGEAPNNQPSTSGKSEDKDGHDIEEGDDINEGDEAENIEDVDDVPEHGEETPILDAGLSREQC